MTSRQLRLVHAAAVSAVATLIAAVSHTIGGGTAPHPLLIAAVAVLFLTPTAVLIGSRPSRIRVAVAVLTAQGAFHVLFQLLGAPSAAGAGTAAAGGGHAHHLALAALAAVGGAPVAPVDTGMIGAHIAAAVLTTVLLWHAESMVRAVAGWFRALLRRASPHPGGVPGRPAALRSLVLPAVDRAVAAAVSRRGPPVLARG